MAASRSPFKVVANFFSQQSNFFSLQSSQEIPHLLPADAVTINKTERHQDKLGEGSYAKVYRGQYNGLPCAVKVFNKDCLKKELSDPGHEFELAYLKGMTHENIVKVYGLWIDPHKGRNVNAIVMELCDDSLLGHIEKHKGRIMAIDQKLQILNGVCKGMIFLHNQGIVHGDLRAPNILLVLSDDQKIAKVSDFGMSRYVDTQKLNHLTLKHADEEYLPPEVFHEKHQRTPKQKFACLTFEVDIFCFGTLALQLAMGCGEFPTPSKKVHKPGLGPPSVRTEVERRSSHLKKLKQSDKEVIDPIVRRCLADKPEDRPSFTDLHTTIETKLRRYTEQPDLQLLQEKIAEVEWYRAMEPEWKEAINKAEELEKVLADKADVLQAKDELLRDFEAETDVQREKIAILTKEKDEATIAHQAHAAALQKELQDLKNGVAEKDKQIGRKDFEIEQLRNEEEKRKRALELAEQAGKDAIAKHESDKTQLTKDLQEKDSALTELNEKLQKVLLERKELDDIQAQLHEANLRLQLAEQEKEELKQSLQMSNDVIAKKAAESTEASEKLHTLKTELAEHSKRCQELEKEKQQIQEKVSRIEDLNKDQNRQLMEGAASLKRQVEDKDKEIEVLELERNNLNEQLANARQQHEQDEAAWAQARQSLSADIETLKTDAESYQKAKAALESSQTKWEEEKQRLQGDHSAVTASLELLSADHLKQVDALKSELQQKQLAAENLESSMKAAQDQATKDKLKIELVSHVLKDTEDKYNKASLRISALQDTLNKCQNEVSNVTAHANHWQEEKSRIWREKEENEVAWRKEKEKLQQSHDRALKQKESDFARERKDLESRHAKEMASAEQGIEQIRASLEELESMQTEPLPNAKKKKRVALCNKTDTLQDAKRLANNLLKEKSDWMEKEREFDRTQKLLVEAESKVISLKDELQICEKDRETLRTEKNDFMTRYQELLQQRKVWESAIADRDAAKKAMSQAQDEKDRLVKEHKELQDHCDRVNKRLRVVQHEKSQMAAKLQGSTMGNDAAGLISDSDYRDAEENDNAISGQEALRKQNEQLQRQQMELTALLSERIASTVAEEQKVLIARCEESITAMEGKLKQVATFFPRLKVKCDSVALQMERLKDYHELKGMLHEATSLKDENIQAKKELKEALNCAELKKVKLHNVTRERDSLQHMVTDERKKSAHLQEANLRLQNDVQEFGQKCKQRTQHMESYRTLLSEVSLEAESLHADRTKLEEELASAQSATGTLREQLSTVTQEMQQVSSERDVFRGAKEAHENTIRELVNKVEETEEGRRTTAEDLNHLKELYEQADVELSQARRTISDLQNENQALQNANDEQKESLESIESKWTQSSQSLSAERVEKDNLQMQLTQVKEELELQISKMEKVTHEKVDVERNFLKMMQNQQLSSQRKITQIEAEKDEQCSHVATLRVTVSELQTELHSLQGASEKLQISQQRMASTEDQLAKVMAALLRSEETLVMERSGYAALQDKMQASLTSAHNDFEEKLKATEKKLTARNDDYGQLEDGHMYLQEKYQAQTEELQKMTDQYEEAIKQLHILEVDKASLHRAFQEKADICVRLEEKTNRMAASKEAVKQQKRGYSQAKTELQRALQEVEVVRAKLREREEQIEAMKQTLQGMLARLSEQVHKSTSEAVKEHLQQLHEDSRRHVADRRQSEEAYWHQLQSQMQNILDKEQAAMVKMAEDVISVCETEKDTYRKELQAHTAHTQDKFLRDVGASVQAELSKVKQKLPERPIIPTAKDLLLFHTLANSCNPAYLLSSSKCVMPDEDLRSACDSRSIKCVFIGAADKLLQKHEICIPRLIRDFIVGAVEILAKKPRLHFCCTVPYVTFTKDVSLCNLLISQNAAACDSESRKLHLEVEVALTQVTLLPHFSKAIKLQPEFVGTPFRPYWHGKEPSEEDSWAQAIQKVNKLPHELVNIFKVLSAERAKAIRANLEKQLSYV